MKKSLKTTLALPLARVAIPTLAEIKSAVETFDRGDANAFDALDAIAAAVEAYRAAASDQRRAA